MWRLIACVNSLDGGASSKNNIWFKFFFPSSLWKWKKGVTLQKLDIFQRAVPMYFRVAQWLKITQKASFYNLASEASWIYFLVEYIWIFAPKINIWIYVWRAFLIIFGAKFQIFHKLTIELNKCHFWRENSNGYNFDDFYTLCALVLSKGGHIMQIEFGDFVGSRALPTKTPADWTTGIRIVFYTLSSNFAKCIMQKGSCYFIKTFFSSLKKPWENSDLTLF